MRAFGFDLRPLLVRAADITHAAAEAQAAADRLRRLREEVVVLKRDALKLCVYGQENGITGDWSAIEAVLLDAHKQLRRQVTPDLLEALKHMLSATLNAVHNMLRTKEMGGSDADSERHHQN